ncbi:MAG: ABC transporter substrate-binding protein [Actinomycetota bacterium]|nr:ABC transporter substrate-binding protein [Actinomycetota bacterium]
MVKRASWTTTRRGFLRTSGLAALAAACGTGGGSGGAGTEGTEAGPGPTAFASPATSLSGDLKILLWSHFVPRHDEWFDPFAKTWGEEVGVNVSVEHMNVVDIPARIQAEIQAGAGHDLIQYIAPLPQFEPSVVDMRDVTEEANRRFGAQLELCTKSSFNPTTGKYYAFSPSWAPDPGNYRRSLWETAGLPDGPSTWDELLEGGARIKRDQGVQLGIGMSQEIDSNMAARALIWSFGGAIQDENENVIINSEQTMTAVEFMKKLYEETMTQEVFAWNPASNNQGLIAGQLSYILNSISAWRTAQEANPDVADDVLFVSALQGPAAKLAAQHVMYNWIVPSHSRNVDAAKEFLLHYTSNFEQACYESKLYDFPAYRERVPRLDEWLSNDPFGANPREKLAVLKEAVSWSTNVGHRGPANTAVGEVFATFIIPNMMAKAARGELSAKDAVTQAEAQIKPIFDKWRARGLIGGGRA